MTTLMQRARPALSVLARQATDWASLVLSMPFIAIGLLGALLVNLTLWVVAAVMVGYAAGRNDNA